MSQPQQYGPPQQQYHAPPALRCRFCGCVPAVDVTFRGHQGFLVVMRFLHLGGPYCRDCGLATFRQMTARTLVQGWYGLLSFLITPITVLVNVTERAKVVSLPAPQPFPYGESRAPMNPEPPLLARPTAVVGMAIPVVLVLVLVVVVALSGG
jgi:hypothetical protein